MLKDTFEKTEPMLDHIHANGVRIKEEELPMLCFLSIIKGYFKGFSYPEGNSKLFSLVNLIANFTCFLLDKIKHSWINTNSNHLKKTSAELSISDTTIAVVHAYEGLAGKRNGRYYPYQGAADRKGVLTIGRGHVLTEKDLKSGRFDNGLTLEEVDLLFKEDIQSRAKKLQKLIPVHTENEFAAALSFFYNIESAWGKDGSPGRYHRAGDKKRAAESFLLYHKSGKPLTPQLGLWRRRGTEALLYLTGEVLIAKDKRSENKLFDKLKHLGIKFNKPNFV